MKNRKLIVISALGLVLLAGLVTVWWFLGDDAWVKGKIEDSVAEMAGRSLSIEGAFSLDWSAHPVLTAENIHFSNPPWAMHPDLARLDKLEVSIDLFSILGDQVKINYIAIHGLVIALEEHESGEKSWEILTGQEEPAPTSEAPPAELPVTVGRITLADFLLLHEAPDRTVPFDFHLEQLELTQGADQQLQFITDGRFGGELFDVDGNLGPLNELVAGGKTSHDIRFTVGEIVLLSQGSIEESSTLSGANVKLAFSGPEFEWILTQLALPQFSHGDFDFRLDLQTEGDQTRLSLDGDLGSLQAYARGGIEDLAGAGSADLTADVSGDDLGGLLEVVGVSGIPRNPFSLKVDISHASGLFHLQTLMLETGDNIASVSGQMGDWPQLADTELDFSVSGPDLRSWGEALHTDMLPDTDFDLSGRISRAGSQPVSTDTQLRLGDSRMQLSGSLGKLPSMTGANLTITADGPVDGVLVKMLKIEGLPGDDFRLRAELERDDSYIYLNDIGFDLAGNHLKLSGRVGNWPDLEGTNLLFSLGGPDLSIWGPILKTDALPASDFTLGGSISPGDIGFEFNNTRLEIGQTYVAVSGTLGELPGLAGTTLNIDAAGPNLAEFRGLPGLENVPADSFRILGRIGKDQRGLTFDGLELMLGDNSLRLNGLMTLNENFTGSDLQTRVDIPSLSLLGPLLGVEDLPDLGLSLNGHYQRQADGWAFKLSNGTIGGATFESEGKFIAVDGRQEVEATSHVIVPNMAQLGRLLNVGNLPEQALDVKGFVRYDTGQIEIRDLQGKVGDSSFKVTAKLGKPPDWSGTELSISASGPDIGQLLPASTFEKPLSFSLSGQASKNETGIRVSAMEAGLGSLKALVDGSIGNLEDMSATNLQITVTAPSLENIGKLLDQPLPDYPFRLNTRFEGSPTEFHAEQLEIILGPSDLSGDLRVDLGEKPRVRSILKSSYLDLAWLQSTDDEEKADKPEKKSDKALLIPDSPITSTRLDFADIDIELTAKKVDFRHQAIHDTYIHARTIDGNLYVDPFQVRGEKGGLLKGAFSVEQEGELTTAALSLGGKGVQLGIGTVEGQDPDTIEQADLIASLTAKGATYRDLARSLDGYIEVVQGPGLSTNAGLSLIFGNFLGELLSLINPFSETQEYTVNECSVIVANFESGLITLDPVVAQTDKLTIVVQGTVDLNTEKLDIVFNTKLRKGVGISISMVVNPFINLTGTLSSPSIGLDPAAVAVKGTVAVATLGLSLLAKSLTDRYFSSKDPCGDALKKAREQ